MNKVNKKKNSTKSFEDQSLSEKEKERLMNLYYDEMENVQKIREQTKVESEKKSK
jgi:hypothetical protein